MLHICIISRKRKWNNNTFYEFLFSFNSNDKKLMLCPWHTRFQNRIEQETKIKLGTANVNWIVVSSTPFEMEEISEYKIQNSQGLWLVANDMIQKGEIPQEKIPGKQHFFNVDIFESHANLVKELCLHSNISIDFPLSLYHGTEKKNTGGILLRGINESWGMLGKAIYAANFWKACRFACFTKEYHDQEGVVFKILVFVNPGKFQTFPFIPWTCQCSPECKKSCSDHLGIWQIMYDGAHVKTGNEKGELKNEEWGIKERFVYTTSYAEIKNYIFSPYKRNIEIK